MAVAQLTIGTWELKAIFYGRIIVLPEMEHLVNLLTFVGSSAEMRESFMQSIPSAHVRCKKLSGMPFQ